MKEFKNGDLVSFTVDSKLYLGYVIGKSDIGSYYTIDTGKGKDKWQIFANDITLESHNPQNQ